MTTCFLQKQILFISLWVLTFTPVFAQDTPLFVDMSDYEKEFYFDIRYATDNNFLNQTLYDCAKCLLLPEVAEAIRNANFYFCDLGYRITFFDCYRPLSVQEKMWQIKPNPIYVANPDKGSVHNRGAAIDVTISRIDGSHIDMGSDYDFFGKASHIDNFNLPEVVLENRKILQEGLQKFGFSTIQSEWWHFNYLPKARSPVYDKLFDCE